MMMNTHPEEKEEKKALLGSEWLESQLKLISSNSTTLDSSTLPSPSICLDLSEFKSQFSLRDDNRVA